MQNTVNLHLPQPWQQAKGFTLIEILIVVAILGVLAAIAFPQYTQYVNKTRRVAAQEQMLQVQQFMERYYGTRDTYANADATGGAFDLSGLERYPMETTQAALYNISISPPALTATTYTITATRTGAMTGDVCGNFTLNSVGQRALVGADAGQTLGTCWP